VKPPRWLRQLLLCFFQIKSKLDATQGCDKGTVAKVPRCDACKGFHCKPCGGEHVAGAELKPKPPPTNQPGVETKSKWPPCMVLMFVCRDQVRSHAQQGPGGCYVGY